MDYFSDLKKATATDLAGYRGYDAYPVAYQAAEFPAYGRTVRLTGNNQAFFFAAGIKDESGKVVDVQPNDAAFRKLVSNILAQSASASGRPKVQLQIDADLFENPERFVRKYQELRPEATRAERERLLTKEAEIIRIFVNDGAMHWVVREQIADEMKASTRAGRPEPSQELIDAATKAFFDHNLRFEGVRTEKPLSFATWEIAARDDYFMARQEYKNSTYMVDRPWQLGLEEALKALSAAGYKGPGQVLEATRFTRALPTVDLNYGYPPRGAMRPGVGPQARPSGIE